MRKPFKLVTLAVLLTLISGMILPVGAQDAPGPGEGGIIIEGNYGGDPPTFNPLYCTGTDCQDEAINFMFPTLVGADPATATMVPGADDALAETWEVSEDGTVYTISLREDLFWTDGEQVTADDIMYTWENINTPEAESPDQFLLETIANIEKIDDFTVRVTFFTPDCNAMANAGSIQAVPSHIFPENVVEAIDMYATEAPVTAGVFQFGTFLPGEQFAMIPNQDFPDTQLGYVVPEGRIVRQVPDATVHVEQFLAGEINAIRGPGPERKSDIRALGEAGDAQVFDFPGNTWDYVGVNLADPANPQPGLDEDGNPIPQDPHPIFGDQRVRMALALGMDVDAILEGAVFGEGTRMASVTTPSSWAYNDALPLIPYDAEQAAAMLEDAGWTDEDGDGVRECHGCMYAEEGTPLEFELITNEGNTRREAIATLLQDQWSDIGVQVNFTAIDFNTLLEQTDAQEYDMFVLGWRDGYPDDPDSLTQLFGAEADVPGSGFNNTSYYNAEVLDLLAQARALPGCDPAERSVMYHQIQEIMQQDLPYLPLFVQNGMYAARNIEGFSPEPAQMYWNIDTWAARAEN